MDKLTITQALEQGYTHYNVDQEEEVGKLKHLLENGVEEYNRGKKLVLLSRSLSKFHISEDTIIELLTSHIDNQDQVFDESEKLYDELGEADFAKITELVNVGFKERFMFPTDIELILESEVNNG